LLTGGLLVGGLLDRGFVGRGLMGRGFMGRGFMGRGFLGREFLVRCLVDVQYFLSVVVGVCSLLRDGFFVMMRFVLILLGLDIMGRLFKILSHLTNLALLNGFALLGLPLKELASSVNTVKVVHLFDSLDTGMMAFISLQDNVRLRSLLA
jgi:hypothetical protein